MTGDIVTVVKVSPVVHILNSLTTWQLSRAGPWDPVADSAVVVGVCPKMFESLL